MHCTVEMATLRSSNLDRGASSRASLERAPLIMTCVARDASNTNGICCLDLLGPYCIRAIHCKSVVDLRDDLSGPLFGRLLFMYTLIDVSQPQLIPTRRCKGLSKRVMLLMSFSLL